MHDAVALEADLRRGLAENEFEVLYQPIIRLGDRTIAGFEALLRWSHPQRGLISPAEFIPHSERTGSIIALGQLVLERAADDLADWQRYFPVEPPLFASVNLSRRQLCDQNLRLAIRQILATGRLQPGSFVLEITESAAATRHEIRRTLEELHSMGAGLAMDDFGTGFSSLSRLKDFPFDTIKIDKSFLAEKRDANGDAVVSSMVALARQMCRTVIAEGVETERDALWLTELGCEYAQGFHFAAPLSCHEALKFIAKKFKTDAALTFGRAAPQARPA